MIRYSLENLIKVRAFRENAASTEVRARQHLLEDATKQVQEKKKAVEDYRVWRIQKEDDLYDGIRMKLLRVKDLDDLKQRILLLRDKESFLEKEVLDAETLKIKAKEALETAKETYNQAVKDKRKLEEHKRRWMEDISVEVEREKEKEMEEFMGKSIHNGDDDDDSEGWEDEDY